MKRNHLITLIVVALVLGGIAYTTSRKQASPAPSRMGELLLKDVSLNDITTIHMTGESDATTLTQTDGGWVVASKYSYPANYERLHRAVVALSEVKIEHGLTVTDKQKTDMNITDAAARVQFLNAADTVLAEIILGDVREQDAPPGSPYGGYPNGRFVSTDGGKSVVVISDPLNDFANDRPESWLDSELFSLTSADVAGITISGSNREPVTLTRNQEDNTLTLSDLKEDEELDSSKRQSAESALSYMRFSDVADPALTDAALGMSDAIIFEAVTTNKTLYTVKIGATPEGSEDRYARIAVSSVGQDEPMATDEDPEADETARKQRAEAARKVREDAVALNDLFSRWTYILPSYKVQSLTMQRSDFIKEPVEAETTDAAPATTAVAEPTVVEAPVPETTPSAPAVAPTQPAEHAESTTQPVDPGSK